MRFSSSSLFNLFSLSLTSFLENLCLWQQCLIFQSSGVKLAAISQNLRSEEGEEEVKEKEHQRQKGVVDSGIKASFEYVVFLLCHR